MVSEAGLKRKQGGIDVNDLKKLISFVEGKISTAEEYETVQGQPCIQPFMHLENFGWAGQVCHNTVMRLTNHSAIGDALWFQLVEDLGKFSINEFYLITGLNCVGSTHLPVVDSQLISRYFSTVRGVLSWEATRAAIYHTMGNRMSSKRRPLKKNYKVHYSLPRFPHALLVWASETLPSIASKFTTKNEQAIPHMMSWTTAENVKFDDVVAAFTTVGESQLIPPMVMTVLIATGHNSYDHPVITVLTECSHYCCDRFGGYLKGFVLMLTEEELNNPWVARLFLKNPTVMPQLPSPKSSVPQPSTDTNSEWREFQTEIRGHVASVNKKLDDLKREQKQSNKLLRRVLKMLSANIIEKGEGKAEPAPSVSSIHEINAERAELDAIKTTSPDIGSVADIGVQAAMEFLTADKVIVSHEDAENDMNQAEFVPPKQVDEGDSIPEGEGMRDPGIQTKDEKVEEEIILEQDFIKVVEPGNDESGDVIPKKKRTRLSRLGQCPARPMTDVGSPSIAPTKQPNALPPGLADEPPKKTLEEFRDKRPPRYGAKYELFDKPHDLGFMALANKTWYYELTISLVWLWDEHINVAFYYLRKKIRQYPELEQRKVTTVALFSVRRLMLGVRVQSGSSWFEVNTLLIPIHFVDLKHWALVKLELTNWTIEVYDSLQHEGSHNSKVRRGMEALSKFIPLLTERLSLFEFKPREPPGTYPILVTIMTDIPRQGNGGDCGIYTIKNAECLIEGRDVRYWVIQERMQIFREWMACYLWGHARRKLEGQYKSDDDVDMGF
ncbi:hypothetical protein TIFTF001_045068 [Ficus carica]|uniref:Ubiquitin-like protease family profile domain-containing protein n=1 Tax=Ficus carica TaxID=3494 RepID=A0AA87YQ06_FICCA|nr:hypothetical protein TIFTF001_045068 [Ficus carica]